MATTKENETGYVGNRAVDKNKGAADAYVQLRADQVKDAEKTAEASVKEMKEIQELDKKNINDQMEIREDPALVEAPSAVSIEATAEAVRQAKKAEFEATLARDKKDLTEPAAASGSMEGVTPSAGKKESLMHSQTHPKASDVPPKSGAGTPGPLSSKDVK